MSTQIYTKAEPYWNGSLLTEATTVKINRDSKATQQETIARGWAGVSPGAKMMTVTVDNAVPSADFELNAGSWISGLKVGELTIFVAGRSITSKGFIVSDDFSYGVNGAATYSFSFVGEFADFQ